MHTCISVAMAAVGVLHMAAAQENVKRLPET